MHTTYICIITNGLIGGIAMLKIWCGCCCCFSFSPRSLSVREKETWTANWNSCKLQTVHTWLRSKNEIVRMIWGVLSQCKLSSIIHPNLEKKYILRHFFFFWNSFTRYKRNCRERRARTKVYNTWTCPWHEDVTMTDILVQERMNSLLPRMTPVMVVWFVMHSTFGAYCTTKHI